MTRIAASAYRIPTDLPEADGTLSWTSTTMVLVEARSDGHHGIGWTYAPAPVAALVGELLAPAVEDVGVLDVPDAHERMCRAVRNAGRPGASSMAISAVDCALWDLKARVLGLPLHRLFGACRADVPVYGSGGFTTYDDARTREQLEHWVAGLGIPRVKIKIGEARGGREERDLARLRLARLAIGPDAELYADANGAYSVKQAVQVAHAAENLGLRWFEEPVPSDDPAGLRAVRDAVECEVAAGEYGYDLPYFRDLIGAVDCPQADVTRCGGYTEFLRVAGLARAHNRELSAHCAPHLHAAVMAAIPNARHIEWFHDHVRIESMLFDGVLDPDGGTVRPRDGEPGLGLAFRRPDAERFRVA
ncbi:enolase C-terminal domain-like protein [Actinomadura rupiterrae]|uniref:enolase C-terminal domain-like protein n=1 Tax=Actinomadura rupiterrae TaxID=559627 RepID=UPI0020A6062C|nr:enolase C-terminal domain-like protein [Actinomadura rupiterrae]MCP2336304.1 L-alanine-DL-glutamate epimerase-like enolase superfamily enzyme [Actinomadura rupiterrae]